VRDETERISVYLSNVNLRVQQVRSTLQSLADDHGSGSRKTRAVEQKSNLYQSLLSISEPLALSYAQVREDLEDSERTSWAGTAHEIRELVSTMLRLLAPDHEVTVQPWFRQDPKTSGPTQKQRVKYILQQHGAGSKRQEVAAEVDIIEARTADLVRATYSRASDAAHRMKGRTEAVRIFRYFEAFAYDLLDIE